VNQDSLFTPIPGNPGSKIFLQQYRHKAGITIGPLLLLQCGALLSVEDRIGFLRS
jgi:hypothetical protein